MMGERILQPHNSAHYQRPNCAKIRQYFPYKKRDICTCGILEIMKKAHASNRRREGQERAHVHINVNLATLGPYYLSKLTNISSGGAFIQHPKPHAVGTIIELSFQLPNDPNKIQTKAKVVWKYIQGGKSLPNGTGMGIQFMEIAIDDEKRIRQYISSILCPDEDTGEVEVPSSPLENQMQ